MLTVRDANVVYETEMKETAREKYLQRQKEALADGREGVVHPYNGLVSKMLMDLETTLEASIDRKGRFFVQKSRASGGYERLAESGLPARVLCAIACRSVIDGISKGHRLQSVLVRIGSRIEDEIRLTQFRKREPLLWDWMQARFKERSSEDYRHKRRMLMAALKKANSAETWVPWDTRGQAEVGIILLGAMSKSGWIETSVHRSEFKRNRSVSKVQLTPEAQQAITQADERAVELLRPWFKPMLEVPIPWSSIEDGGYVTIPLTLVKTRNRNELDRLAAAEMPTVYSAVNAVQATAWRVNDPVFEVAQQMRRASASIQGLPEDRELTRPERPDLPPVGEELDDAQKAQLGEYKAARREWFNGEARRKSKSTQSLQILTVAEELREQTFYFPHQLDYRGRLYAVPIQLNPQSNDLARGLLTFADGRALGDHGGFWLAVHGANTFGKDKGSLAARVDWVLEQSDAICAVAEDPFGNQWWTEADKGEKPWQFLAFCFEWADYVRSGESPDFVSHLPVSVDGSCNGLQHFSAMLRDRVGATATNLTADKVQHDIYQIICDRVIEEVKRRKELSATERELAGKWLEWGIERSTVKRPVMTTPYGVTKTGMRTMVMEDSIGAEGRPFFAPDPWAAANWMADVIYDVIGETVSSAQDAMRFLQGLAMVLASENQAMCWTTPSGFPVLQYIRQMSSFQIDTTLMGRVKLRFSEVTPKLDKIRQKSACAPNVVHSYDAAHLMMTVVELERQLGRRVSWAMVHDSYGTHAGDIDQLNRVLREQFVAIYESENPLEAIRDRVVETVQDCTDVPIAPEKGDFDIREVLKAEFFFA